MTGFSLPDMYRMHYTQPIERAALEATAEIVELNSWLDDDLKCQSRHAVRGLHMCTVEVTHHFTRICGDVALLVCKSVAVYVDEARGGSCAVCGGDVEDCWKVRPI